MPSKNPNQFLHRIKLTTTKVQGIPTEHDWKQAQRVLDDLISGRPISMTEFHGENHGLFEVRTSRKNRLIFQKVNIENQEVYFLTTFEVDHNHNKLTQHFQNTTKQKIPTTLNPVSLKNIGYVLSTNHRANIQDATAASTQHGNIYYNAQFITPDDRQQNILSNEKTPGVYLIAAPAGAGKTLCSAGLIQQFYEHACEQFNTNTFNHQRHIIYISKSETLCNREKENFLAWDPEHETNPAAKVEFIPYDFFAFRSLNQQFDADYYITDNNTNKQIINPTYLKWKKEQLVSKKEILTFIKEHQKSQKKIAQLNTPDKADIADINIDILYQELILNSAILNLTTLNNEESWQTYLNLGVRQSEIPKEPKTLRQAVIKLYHACRNFIGNQHHLPFSTLSFPDAEKPEDIIFDEAQDLSAIEAENIQRCHKERCIFMGDNQQSLDGQSILQQIRRQATNTHETDFNLEVNYRTPPTLMHFLNQFIQLKHSMIGLTDKEDHRAVKSPDEQWEAQNPRHAGEILFSEQQNHSAKKTSDEIDGTNPDFAVITFASEDEIPELRKKYNTHLVLTPRQVKGLEFKNILIDGAFDDARCKAIENLLKKPNNLISKDTANRKQKNHEIEGEHDIATWSNSFYVCATRATEKLIIEKPLIAQKHNNRHLIASIEYYINNATKPNKQEPTPQTNKIPTLPNTNTSIQEEINNDLNQFRNTLNKIAQLIDNDTLERNTLNIIAKGLLKPFYPALTDEIVSAFLDMDNWKNTPLIDFIGFAHAKYVTQILSKTETQPRTYTELWGKSGIFKSKSLKDTFISCFNNAEDEKHLTSFIDIISKLFCNTKNHNMLARAAKPTETEKKQLKSEIHRIAIENDYDSLLKPNHSTKENTQETKNDEKTLPEQTATLNTKKQLPQLYRNFLSLLSNTPPTTPDYEDEAQWMEFYADALLDKNTVFYAPRFCSKTEGIPSFLHAYRVLFQQKCNKNTTDNFIESLSSEYTDEKTINTPNTKKYTIEKIANGLNKDQQLTIALALLVGLKNTKLQLNSSNTQNPEITSLKKFLIYSNLLSENMNNLVLNSKKRNQIAIEINLYSQIQQALFTTQSVTLSDNTTIPMTLFQYLVLRKENGILELFCLMLRSDCICNGYTTSQLFSFYTKQYLLSAQYNSFLNLENINDNQHLPIIQAMTTTPRIASQLLGPLLYTNNPTKDTATVSLLFNLVFQLKPSKDLESIHESFFTFLGANIKQMHIDFDKLLTHDEFKSFVSLSKNAFLRKQVVLHFFKKRVCTTTTTDSSEIFNTVLASAVKIFPLQQGYKKNNEKQTADPLDILYSLSRLSLSEFNDKMKKIVTVYNNINPDFEQTEDLLIDMLFTGVLPVNDNKLAATAGPGLFNASTDTETKTKSPIDETHTATNRQP